MNKIFFVSLFLFVSSAFAINELEHLTPEQADQMQSCMLQSNDLHSCYTQVVKVSSENCAQDFKTGNIVCQQNSISLRRNGNEEGRDSKNSNSDSQCSTAFYTANSQCNGSAITQSPQSLALINTIQSQKSVGNIKEACAAAKNLNSMAWSLNATLGMKCQSAISQCLNACSSDSSERETCKGFMQNVKLAQNQAIENAKSYSQSQECVAAVTGCGNNSYDNPNCPVFCLKPGRQNDSLCTNQKALAQNGLKPLQQINSKTIESQSPEVGVINQAKPQERFQEYDNSKNDLITNDEPSPGSMDAASVAPSGAGSYAAGAAAGLPSNNKKQNDNNNEQKPATAIASANNGSNDGGSAGSSYTPTDTSGYPDTFIEPEEKPSWYDLRRFLPLTKAQIEKNGMRYTQKLFAEARRLEWERKHPGFKKQNYETQNHKTQNQNIVVENERIPASIDTKIRFKNRIFTILDLLIFMGIIYFFFIRENSENT
jgi:hypothetical protein